MNRFCCQKIEDFLDDDLSVSERLRFKEAVDGCPECQRTIEDQEKFNDEMKRAWKSVAVPTGLAFAAEREFAEDERSAKQADVVATMPSTNSLDTSRWASLTGAIVLATAIVAAIFGTPNWRPEPETSSVAAGEAKAANEDNATTAAVVVEFDERAVGVVDEISDDSFTLVRVYPTIQTTDVD